MQLIFAQHHQNIDLQLPFFLNPCTHHQDLRYKREGHWSDKESLRYSSFLKIFRNILQNPQTAARVRFFDMMADMVITRTSRQCRNHHKKMENYHRSPEGLSTTLSNIIDSIAKRYQPVTYEQLSEKYLILIKSLLQNECKYLRKVQHGCQSRSSSSSCSDVGKKKQKQKLKRGRAIKAQQRGNRPQGGCEINGSDQKIQVSTVTTQNQILNRIPEQTQSWPLLLLKDQIEIRSEKTGIFWVQGEQVVADFAEVDGAHLPDSFCLDQKRKSLLERRLALMQEKLKWHEQVLKSVHSHIEKEKRLTRECQESISGFRSKALRRII